MAKRVAWHGSVLRARSNSMKLSILLVAGFCLVAGVFAAIAPQPTGYALIAAVTILLLALPSFLACIRWLGKRGWLVLLSLSMFAIAIESFALAFGVPYGRFSYGAAIGVKLLGVPWTVPFAYVPLVLGAWALFWSKQKPVHSIAVVVASLLLIDLVLDPGAVALGYWRYVAGGWYYAVPWTNFAGWIVSGSLAAGMLYVLTRSPVQPPAWMALSALFIVCFWTGVAFANNHVLPSILGAALIELFAFKLTQKTVRAVGE